MGMFYRDNNAYIMNEDMLHTSIIEDNHIDLIVTSPPYNLDINYDKINDSLTYELYLENIENWLSKCLTWVKPDGRLCLNIPIDTSKNANKTISADIAKIAQKVGWNYKTTIIWNKNKPNKAFGSFMSASSPNVISTAELILVFYKKHWKKLNKGVSDIDKNEFVEWSSGIWTFNGEARKKDGHPAPFPEELPKRCIKLFSYVGDIVLDPFMGSGTTVVVANKLNRKAIGIEISRKYCELALDRLMKI